MRQKTQRFNVRQNMQCNTFEIFHYNEPAETEVKVHNHDFYEVFFLIDGDISYWLEGEIYKPQKGDVIFIDPVTLHRPIIPPDTTSYERIVLWIDKSYLDSISTDKINLSECFENKSSYLLHPNSSQRAELTEKFGNLVREYYSDDYGASLYADGLFLQIMIELNRMRISADKPYVSKDTSPLVLQVVEYISEHFSENLSLDGLAEKFYVSKYHLSHEFSNNVGISVYKYIMLKRLTAAKRMLMENVSPGEAYLRCGFKDYTNFFRAFKAEYGISPRDYSSKV